MDALNTHVDLERFIAKNPAGAKEFLARKLVECKAWVLIEKLAGQDVGVIGENQRVVSVFDSETGQEKERYQYEYKEDPGSELFRLGFSVKESEDILAGLGVDLESIETERQKRKALGYAQDTLAKEQAAAQEAIFNDPVRKFNSKQFFGRLIQEFDQARWFALSKLGVGWTMQQLVDYPNFAGLKAYANGLLMDGTISLEDAGKINSCLLEQNINLETL